MKNRHCYIEFKRDTKLTLLCHSFKDIRRKDKRHGWAGVYEFKAREKYPAEIQEIAVNLFQFDFELTNPRYGNLIGKTLNLDQKKLIITERILDNYPVVIESINSPSPSFPK